MPVPHSSEDYSKEDSEGHTPSEKPLPAAALPLIS